MGRTHGVHAEPTTFGLKLLGWCVRARSRAPPARSTRSRRAGWASCRARSARMAASTRASRRSRCERLGLESDPGVHTGRLPRPPRGAPVRARARARPRSIASRPRSATCAQRGPRGGGAVRRRPEGLVGDAAQAQPDRLRAHLRPRRASSGANALVGFENQPPLARARHLALLGRARRRRSTRPRLDYLLDRFSLGRRRARRPPRADAAQPRGLTRALLLGPLLLALVEAGRRSRTTPTRVVQRNAMRAWDEELPLRGARRAPTHRSPSTCRTRTSHEVFDLDATIAHARRSVRPTSIVSTAKEVPVHA